MLFEDRTSIVTHMTASMLQVMVLSCRVKSFSRWTGKGCDEYLVQHLTGP